MNRMLFHDQTRHMAVRSQSASHRTEDEGDANKLTFRGGSTKLRVSVGTIEAVQGLKHPKFEILQTSNFKQDRTSSFHRIASILIVVPEPSQACAHSLELIEEESSVFFGPNFHRLDARNAMKHTSGPTLIGSQSHTRQTVTVVAVGDALTTWPSVVMATERLMFGFHISVLVFGHSRGLAGVVSHTRRNAAKFRCLVLTESATSVESRHASAMPVSISARACNTHTQACDRQDHTRMVLSFDPDTSHCAEATRDVTDPV